MKKLFGLMALAGALAGEGADWPAMCTYDAAHLLNVAMPLGGIATGGPNLGGRGEIRDWLQITGEPYRGACEVGGNSYHLPFFAIHVGGMPATCMKATSLLQGPVDETEYLHQMGDGVPLSGFPRFREASFAAAYPFGEVRLSDPAIPVKVRLRAFNPLVPGDARASSLPLATFTYRVENTSDVAREISICGAFPNPVGVVHIQGDAFGGERVAGQVSNRNEIVTSADGRLRGIHYLTDRTDVGAPNWGSIALATPDADVTYRTATGFDEWRGSCLSVWRDMMDDGRLTDVEPEWAARDTRDPLGAVCVTKTVPAKGAADFTFILAWSFRARRVWNGAVENHYFQEFPNAWQAAVKLYPELPELERRTRTFVEALNATTLPACLKEAGLFNLAVLRSPTTFRVATGELMGWEGTMDRTGSCHGTCKHVWNYEQAIPYLWGDLARTQRDVEFVHSMAADGSGAMTFRTPLPLRGELPPDRQGWVAADGQMGCIIKIYREWRFSGDGAFLVRHWKNVRAALAYAWRKDGWDADADGVMEGSQHNTMDINYSGPNPEVGFWYLGALRAGAEMARAMNDHAFADKCAKLASDGAAWMDKNLFTGEYYRQIVYDQGTRQPLAADARIPNWQIGNGCMADQFIGQTTAFGAGLGELADGGHIRAALAAIMKYNYKDDFADVFNYNRTYAFPGEAGLVNTAWPHGGEPEFPYPYYAEAWTGIEYGAAAALAWEGRLEDAVKIVRAVRARYDGHKRNPFSEIECGHHYARSLAAWGVLVAWSGFTWDGRSGEMAFTTRPGRYFWSNGSAWGLCEVLADGVQLKVLEGTLSLRKLRVGTHEVDGAKALAGAKVAF